MKNPLTLRRSPLCLFVAGSLVTLLLGACGSSVADTADPGSSDDQGSGGSTRSSSASTSSGGSTKNGSGGSGTSAGGSSGASGSSSDVGSGGSSSTGSGGTSGGTGGSTTASTDPTPMGGCLLPSVRKESDAKSAYDLFVNRMMVQDGSNWRVQRPEDSNDTVSEGIGYGMLLAAYMGDCDKFKGLWAYEQAHLDGNGLMNWHISSSGSTAESGSATDADEDMAWALLIADKACSGAGYATAAKTLIGKILSLDIASNNVLKCGDQCTGNEHSGGTNVSYYAPAYYRVFKTVTGESRWDQVVSESYTIIKACSGTYGLVPDWCKPSGGSSDGSYYSYDATRTPLRVGVDLCLNDSADAKTYLELIGAFFNKQTSANIEAGYSVDGIAKVKYGNAAFTGPAAVALMVDTSFELESKKAYLNLLSQTSSATSNYYNMALGAISEFVLNGLFTAP